MGNIPDDDLVAITRSYYDSADADNFYFHIWGGEDIHIGVYDEGVTDIAQASRRTIEMMAARLPRLDRTSRVIDLGAGYGGAARYLARTVGCHVTALNLSAKENARCRAMSEIAGLADRITVVEGSYEEILLPDESIDVVWSQDAILHSGRKDKIFAEVSRVLRPGGDFVFTDPMESGTGSHEELQPVLERIRLTSMGSFERYARLANRVGLERVEFVDLTQHLVRHYARIRDELIRQRAALENNISSDFADRMLVGLDHWVGAGQRGSLAWGVLHFRKA